MMRCSEVELCLVCTHSNNSYVKRFVALSPIFFLQIAINSMVFLYSFNNLQRIAIIHSEVAIKNTHCARFQNFLFYKKHALAWL